MEWVDLHNKACVSRTWEWGRQREEGSGRKSGENECEGKNYSLVQGSLVTRHFTSGHLTTWHFATEYITTGTLLWR